MTSSINYDVAATSAKIGGLVKNRQNQRMAAGVGIMSAALAFALLVFFLADLRALFQPHYTLYAVLGRAPRLRVGAPVWISGHKVGQVTNIAFRPVKQDSTAALAVRLELPRKHARLITRGSRVQITSARLIGEPVIDIIPGDPKAPPVAPGDTLVALRRASRKDVADSFQRLNRSLTDLQLATRALSPAVANRKAQYAHLAARVSALQSEFGNLREVTANGSLGPLLNDREFRRALAHASTTAGELGPAFQSAAARFTDPAFRQSFGQLQQRVAAMSAELQRVRILIANGTVPRFVQDSAIQQALQRAHMELDSLLAETRRSPLRFWLGR